MDLTELFCDVDDFIQLNTKKMLTNNKKYFRSSKLSESEIMTISIAYHMSGYKNFKAFYREYVVKYLKVQFSPNKHKFILHYLNNRCKYSYLRLMSILFKCTTFANVRCWSSRVIKVAFIIIIILIKN